MEVPLSSHTHFPVMARLTIPVNRLGIQSAETSTGCWTGWRFNFSDFVAGSCGSFSLRWTERKVGMLKKKKAVGINLWQTADRAVFAHPNRHYKTTAVFAVKCSWWVIPWNIAVSGLSLWGAKPTRRRDYLSQHSVISKEFMLFVLGQRWPIFRDLLLWNQCVFLSLCSVTLHFVQGWLSNLMMVQTDLNPWYLHNFSLSIRKRHFSESAGLYSACLP